MAGFQVTTEELLAAKPRNVPTAKGRVGVARVVMVLEHPVAGSPVVLVVRISNVSSPSIWRCKVLEQYRVPLTLRVDTGT